MTPQPCHAFKQCRAVVLSDTPGENRLGELALDVCVQRRGHCGLWGLTLALDQLRLQRNPGSVSISTMLVTLFRYMFWYSNRIRVHAAIEMYNVRTIDQISGLST